MVYRLWLIDDGEAYYVDELWPNDRGLLVVHVEVQGAYDEVVVTTEPAGSEPQAPIGPPAWSAAGAQASPAA
jgi:hypothetical protein